MLFKQNAYQIVENVRLARRIVQGSVALVVLDAQRVAVGPSQGFDYIQSVTLARM